MVKIGCESLVCACWLARLEVRWRRSGARGRARREFLNWRRSDAVLDAKDGDLLGQGRTEISRRSEVGESCARGKGEGSVQWRDGEQLSNGGTVPAGRLRLRERVAFHGVKRWMVMLGAIGILGRGVVRGAGGIVVAVVRGGVLGVRRARAQGAGGGAYGAIEQGHEQESDDCELGADRGGQYHVEYYITAR
jgi:hypothetical protein